jgi:hypothetical protein
VAAPCGSHAVRFWPPAALPTRSITGRRRPSIRRIDRWPGQLIGPAGESAAFVCSSRRGALVRSIAIGRPGTSSARVAARHCATVSSSPATTVTKASEGELFRPPRRVSPSTTIGRLDRTAGRRRGANVGHGRLRPALRINILPRKTPTANFMRRSLAGRKSKPTQNSLAAAAACETTAGATRAFVLIRDCSLSAATRIRNSRLAETTHHDHAGRLRRLEWRRWPQSERRLQADLSSGQ